MEAKELIVREAVFDDCRFFAACEREKAVTEFFSMDGDRSYEDVVREFIAAEQKKSKKR